MTLFTFVIVSAKVKGVGQAQPGSDNSVQASACACGREIARCRAGSTSSGRYMLRDRLITGFRGG